MKQAEHKNRTQTELLYFGGHYDKPDSYVTKRPEGMNSWLTTLTLEGEGYFLVEGRKHVCRAGDASLLKPGVPHQYGTCSGKRWNFLWAHFDHMFEVRYLNPDALTVQTIAYQHIFKRIYRLLNWFIQDAQERLPHWQELCASTLREILILLAQRQRNTMDSRVEMAIHLISMNMKEELKVDELAKTVGLSASRLSHLFKETMGETIIEALNRIRLEQAALLLEHTDRNASEAALETGFQNYNHFSSQFRRKFSMTPGVYKLQHHRKN